MALIGCASKSKIEPKPAPPPAPKGRLVPAVVAGFEGGVGKWRIDAISPMAQPPRLEANSTAASRGSKWLSAVLDCNAQQGSVVDVHVTLPRLDWTRFGDALRADFRTSPRCPDATVQFIIVTQDGKQEVSPEQKVGDRWGTVVWQAGAALKDVQRLCVRWRIRGTWRGHAGMDNVRVGAAAALNEAWSVAVGPFNTRQDAVSAIAELEASKVSSFPVFVEGWYLNVGTFSSATAARTESKRLDALGIKTVVVER